MRVYVGLMQSDALAIPLRSNSVDACVTDPPYGIGFMGKRWDTFKPGAADRRVVSSRSRTSDNPNLRGRTNAPA